MSFAPSLPLTGYAGWGVLKRTMAAQQQAFQAGAANRRLEDHFRTAIAMVDTAADLVADRQLLTVALGAYGLDGDLGNRYFIRKVLEDGTLTETALSNRLADKQYQKLAGAFGFDLAVPRSKLSDFADRTISLYRTRQFEAAIGEQNNDYRLAMNAERELPALAARTMGDDAKWFTIMGSAPLRRVIETAFGLPASFGTLDIDQQLAVMKARATDVLGSDSVAQFATPAAMDTLTKTFLLRSELAGGPPATAPGMVALQLLQAQG